MNLMLIIDTLIITFLIVNSLLLIGIILLLIPAAIKNASKYMDDSHRWGCGDSDG